MITDVGRLQILKTWLRRLKGRPFVPLGWLRVRMAMFGDRDSGLMAEMKNMGAR